MLGVLRGRKAYVRVGIGAALVAVFAFAIIRIVSAAAIPQVSFQGVDSKPLVGESTNFTIHFDNVGDNVGYGPYVDLVLPQYLSLSSIEYLGSPLTASSPITFPAGDPSCVTHPFARDNTGQLKQVCLSPNPGTNIKFYSLKLPFGSYTQNQGAVDLQITAAVAGDAPINVPETIRAEGGFYLGTDPLDNPTTDPSFDSGFVTTAVTPQVVKISKQYISDYLKNGSNIAPGPNNEQAFRITADIADGAQIDNLTLADALPTPLVRTSEANVTPGGTDNSTGNNASVTWSSITGGPGTSDATYDVKFYVPYKDGSSNLVLSGGNGYQTSVQNSATISGTYNSQPLSVDPAGPVDLPIKPVVTRKAVTDLDNPGASIPGDTLEYKIASYVSDYHAIGNLNLADVLPDGLTYTPGSATYTVTQNGSTSSATGITPSSTVQPNGTTYLGFDLSATNNLLGGCVPDGGTGGSDPSCALHDDGRTSVEVTFRATINNTYHDSKPVEDDDVLSNSVTTTSDLLSSTNLSTISTTNDTDSASVTVTKGSLDKTLYAVNGSTTLPERIKPGDVMTYRLQYTIPGTDFGDLTLDDYLPLPMFDNSGMSTTFDTTISADAPPTNTAKFGPSETLNSYNSLTPTVSTQSGNVVRFTWPATQDPSNTTRHIDVLFSMTVLDKAYAPGMSITNQATLKEGDSDGSFSSTAINQIELKIPEPAVTKGVVATDNAAGVFTPATVGPVPFSAPGSAGTRFTGTVDSTNLASSPINSNLQHVDSGDKVTYAVVVENKGYGDLYNGSIKDSIPAHMSIPGGGANIRVTDGAGTVLAYTNVGGGSGLFDQGIQLTDPVANADTTTDGTNIVVITYDLQIDVDAQAGETQTNKAELTHFAAEDGGVNYMNNQAEYSDTANVVIASASMTKDITATDLADTTGNNVVIGEQITYTSTLTVPEGTMGGATMVDTLDACLAVVQIDSLTASPGVSASAGSMTSIKDAAVIGAEGTGEANEGRKITLSFGDIVNSNTSNDPATITLVYKVVPINASTCKRGDTRANHIVTSWDVSKSTTPAVAPNVIIQEPLMSIGKSFVPTTGDADDIVKVRLTVNATAGVNHSNAYDVVATDDLNSTNFTYVGNIQTISGPAPTSSGESGGIVTFTWNELDTTQPASVIEFDVRVKESVAQGSTNPNTARVAYTSYPGTPSLNTTNNPLECERTGDTSDCGGSQNTYTHTHTADFTVNSIDQLTKLLATTSESSTTGSNVAIGEIARFRLSARVPEGTDPATVFRDSLPTGLQFLSDSTAKAALVSNGNMTSSTMSGSGLNVTGDETTVSSVTPTYVIPGDAILGGPFSSGTNVDFDFGTVTNTDDDANDEFIVVEFNALVNNIPGVTRGTVLSNQLTVRQNGGDVGNSTPIMLTVLEPNVNVSKTVTTAPVDAGDPVAYGITITNTGATNLTSGFDWRFEDTLDQYLDYQSVTNISSPAYTTATPSVQLGTNDEVTVTFSELRPGDSVSFTINAVVKNNAPADYTVPNTGDATTTSLPGPRGTTTNPTGSSTPGNTGDTNGERQLDGTDSVSTPLGTPAINKQAAQEGPTTSIGATVTYPIVVTVPQGVTLNAVLTDNLPAGLQYMSYSIASGFNGSFANAPPIVASPASAPGGSGEDFILNFGNITVPGDTDDYSTFTVLVTTRVMDIPANQDGHVLSNTASLTFTDPDTGNPTSVNSGTVNETVTEPQLTLAKSLAGADPRAVGQTLDYTIQIENTGDATAYEWQITDDLAPHTTLSGTLTCTKEGNPITVSSSVTGGTLTINQNPIAGSTLAVGEQIVCEYSATIDVTAVVGSTYTNTATPHWWSGPSANPEVRHYDGTPDTAQFTMPDAGFSKSDGGITSAVIGQIVTYTLNIQMPEGTVDDFAVSDVLPQGLVYIDNPSITGAPAISPVISSPNDGSAPVTVDWDFGTLVEPESKNITITYRARVANVSSNQDGTVITNNADLTFTPEGGSPVNENASDTFTVREPMLDITKSADKAGANYGTVVNYTITVAHDAASAADAFNLDISDTVPAGMTLVSGSVGSTDSTWNIIEAGNSFTATKASYTLGSVPTTITYQARVNSPPGAPAPGADLDNTVDIDWTSLSGANPNGRDGSGGVNDYDNSSTESVTADAIDLAISKSDGGASFSPGDTIPYALNVQNLGNVTATGITVTETVPANTTFDATASTSGWSCADNPPAGTVCTYSIASLGPSGSTNVTFAVTISDYNTLPPDVSQISNTATVAADPSNGTEASTNNNSSTDLSPLEIADLQIVKTESHDPVYIVHDYSYTLTVTNNGPDTATDVEVKDTIPDGVSIDSVTSDDPGMSCGFVGQDVTCTMVSLANGGTVEITINVTGDTPGKKINTATVTADQQDPDRDNNSSTIDTLVDPADIVLTKEVDNSTPQVGQTVTFTIGVRNDGPDDATNLVVTDNLPSLFKFASAQPAQGSCSGSGPIICQLGNLANGAQTTIVLKAIVQATGTATNTVSSTITEYDPDPSNNTNIGASVTAFPGAPGTGVGRLLSGMSLPLPFIFLAIATLVGWLTRRKPSASQ